ncbi:MAG: ABC transporter permease [Microbacterium sp.]
MSEVLTSPRSAPLASAGRRLRRRSRGGAGLWIAVVVVASALLFAVFPGLFTSQDPLVGQTSEALQPPSAAHWFGTDNLGRDLFARVVYGASASLTGALIAILIALVVGSAIGLLAGAVGGVVDTVVTRCVDVMLAIPGLLLAMTVVTAIGFGTVNVAVAVGIAAVASFIRLMRSEVFRVRHAKYVEAARVTGESPVAVLLRYIAPNSIGSVLALAALEFGGVLLAISALSFLGYGVQPPNPEWGSLVSQGRDYIATAWWLSFFPGLTIAAVVVAMNRISRAFDHDQEVQA